MDKITLIGRLSPPLDNTLIDQLLTEYNSLENRFILGDWEPATLDGGQFCEAAARILYHIDSTTLNHTRSVDDCLKYVEDAHGSNSHSYPDRKSALHTARVLRSIYKFRSDRGAIHINPKYTANHLDSTLVYSNVKWVLSEIIRIFLTTDLNLVEKIIRDIVEFDLPVIGDYDGKLIVQRTDLSLDEEILILLHYAGKTGLSRTAIGKSLYHDPSSVTKALSRLSSSRERNIIKLQNEQYRLTEIGNKYVLKELADKLRIN